MSAIDSRDDGAGMEPNSPRKIQFTVPLLEPHLDPEAAEQVGSNVGSAYFFLGGGRNISSLCPNGKLNGK